MKAVVLQKNGKVSKKFFTLQEDIFANKAGTNVLRQAVHIHMANTRTGTAKAKNRGEVSGTGKKPWANNKIGKARTGDERTPIFRHGGVSHGPVPMNYGLKLPKKMAEIALYQALTHAQNQNRLFIVEDFTISGEKLTKAAAEIVKALTTQAGIPMKRVVIYTLQYDELLKRAYNNIPGIEVRAMQHMNAYDVLSAGTVILMESVMEVLNGTKAENEKPKVEEKKTEVKTKAPVKAATKTATKSKVVKK